MLAIDEDGHRSSSIIETNKEIAKNSDTDFSNIKKNLSKSGNTPFEVINMEVRFTNNWFLPISKINEIRRTVFGQLMEVRINEYVREEFQIQKTDHPYPVKKLDFTYNVSNKLARDFYKRHGVEEIEKAFELQWDPGKSRVMTTKYCVKYELGKCPKYQKDSMGEKVVEPLVLKQADREYKLKFNCKPCEMEIWERDAEISYEED